MMGDIPPRQLHGISAECMSQSASEASENILDTASCGAFQGFDSNLFNISHRLSALNHMEDNEFTLGGLNGDFAGLVGHAHTNVAMLVEQLANTRLDCGGPNGFQGSSFYSASTPSSSSSSSMAKFTSHHQQNGGIGASSFNHVDDSSSSRFRFSSDRSMASDFTSSSHVNGEYSPGNRNGVTGFNGQQNGGQFSYNSQQQQHQSGGTFGQSRGQQNGGGGGGYSSSQQNGHSSLVGTFGQSQNSGAFAQHQQSGMGNGYGQSSGQHNNGVSFGQSSSGPSSSSYGPSSGNSGGAYGASSQDGSVFGSSSTTYSQSGAGFGPSSASGHQNGVGIESFPGHCSPSANGGALSTSNGGYGFGAGTYSRRSSSPPENLISTSSRPPMREKKVNTTETVRVPSSEHVAEIVGRQGCKIKELRAKTNTYIKTPVRGEEPVFIVTGRKEDVARAEAEIKLQSQHFSDIRANRQMERSKTAKESKAAMIVRVPMNLVGLVVGLKGATIKKIQDDSDTYIQTPQRPSQQPLLPPSSQCKPDFTVRGAWQACMRAEEMIRLHIETRTNTTVVQMNQGKQEPDYAVYANFNPSSGLNLDNMARFFPCLGDPQGGTSLGADSLPSHSPLVNGHLSKSHDFLHSPPSLSNGHGNHFNLSGAGGSSFDGFSRSGLSNGHGFGGGSHGLSNGQLVGHNSHFPFNGFDGNGVDMMGGGLYASQGSSASSSQNSGRRGSITLSPDDIFNRTCSQIDFGCGAGQAVSCGSLYNVDDGGLLRMAISLPDFQLPSSRLSQPITTATTSSSSAFAPVSNCELTSASLTAFMPLYHKTAAAATSSTGSNSPTSVGGGAAGESGLMSCPVLVGTMTQHVLSEEDEEVASSSSRCESTSTSSSSRHSDDRTTS